MIRREEAAFSTRHPLVLTSRRPHYFHLCWWRRSGSRVDYQHLVASIYLCHSGCTLFKLVSHHVATLNTAAKMVRTQRVMRLLGTIPLFLVAALVSSQQGFYLEEGARLRMFFQL